MKSLFLTLTIISFSLLSSAFTVPDSTRNIFEKGLDQLKLQKARHLYLNRDYRGALDIYKQLYNYNQKSPMLNYRLGECNVKIKNYAVAINFFEKALRQKADVDKYLYLNYGIALHRLGELDKAITQFEQFKSSLKENQKTDLEEVERYMRQVKLAKELQANPVAVIISNAGKAINSKFDEHGPTISADGKTLIYTSRREDTKGGLKDPEDFKYYEDIYMSNWNEKENTWSPAQPITGRLNTEDHDGVLSISPNGEEIYVYRNLGNGGPGAGDIYLSRLSGSGKWGTAKEMGKTINTTYFESSASASADGNMLFFISERKTPLVKSNSKADYASKYWVDKLEEKAYGHGDIWVAQKTSRKEYGTAKNLGDSLNTPFDERMVYVHPSGKLLFFSSEGHESMGGYDIFYSKQNKDGSWSKPVNMGYPINTVNDEINFTLSGDNKTAYTSGYKPDGNGENDIYIIDLTNHPVIKELQAEGAPPKK